MFGWLVAQLQFVLLSFFGHHLPRLSFQISFIELLCFHLKSEPGMEEHGLEEAGAGLAAEQVDHHLVGAHHDGGVGDLSDQVGGEATVQCPVALLPRDCQ